LHLVNETPLGSFQPGKGFLNLTNATKGTFVFTPFPDMHGEDTFAFKAKDNLGLESALQVRALRLPRLTNHAPPISNTIKDWCRGSRLLHTVASSACHYDS
jgi:hypothetical protein